MKLLPLLVATATLVAACSSGSTSTSSSPTTASAVSPSTAAGSGTAGATDKVSANTAPEAEIAAALAAAGVASSERWAGEVVEYRPYDLSDPSLEKLRSELTKYNPTTETINQIISALTP